MAKTDTLLRLPRIPDPANYYAGTAQYDSALPHNVVLFLRRHAGSLGPTRAHHHRFVLIVNALTQGTVIIDDRSFRLGAGQAILIFPHQFHHYMELTSTAVSWLFITFELTAPDALAPLRNVPVSLSPAAASAVADLVAAHLANRRSQGSRDAEVTLRTALLLNLLQQQVMHVPARASRPAPGGRFDDLHRYVAGNMQRRLSTAELAHHMALSESHLRLVYRKATGMTLGTYVSEMRLNRASGLLLNSAMSVKQVAAECGYDSLFSFSRAFKRRMGVSPRGYRKERVLPTRLE